MDEGNRRDLQVHGTDANALWGRPWNRTVMIVVAMS
jgi:hypothetical protein